MGAEEQGEFKYGFNIVLLEFSGKNMVKKKKKKCLES